MKNFVKMLKQDRIGLAALVLFLLVAIFITFILLVNVIHLQRFTTPERTIYASEIPLHEYTLLRLGGATEVISDESFADLPDNIEVLRNGSDISFRLASITRLTAYDYFHYRSIVEDALVALMLQAGFWSDTGDNHLVSLLARGRIAMTQYHVTAEIHTLGFALPEISFMELVQGIGWYLVIPIFMFVAPLAVLDLRMRRWRKQQFGIKEV